MSLYEKITPGNNRMHVILNAMKTKTTKAKGKIAYFEKCFFFTKEGLRCLTLTLLWVFLLSLETHVVYAASTCHGRFVNPLTDICWECLFPLTIGGAVVAKSSVPDTPNPKSPLCFCKDGVLPKVGITMGYWEPKRIIEVTPTPFCLVSLGGIQLPLPSLQDQGGLRQTPNRFPGSHYNVHFLAYPVLSWLGLMESEGCHEKGDLELLYFSELDPVWHDEALATLMNPESLIGSHKVSQLACGVDCVKATTHLPDNHLFWCMGCLGSLYPFTGDVASHQGGIQASSLLSARLLALLHHQGQLKSVATDTLGKKLCHGKIERRLPKPEYRLQLLYPKAETSLKKGCQPLGRSPLTWSQGDEYPGAGEHFAYFVFQKHNCCVL